MSPTSYPRVAKTLAVIGRLLPPVNFISIHYAYFIVTSLIASVVFWASSEPHASISYVDSLFLSVSAMTEAGLNTVNLSQMTTWQQAMLFILIVLGSSVWVSIWTVAARIHAFRKRFEDIVEAERQRDARIKERRGSMQAGSASRSLSSLARVWSRSRVQFGETTTNGSQMQVAGAGTAPPHTEPQDSDAVDDALTGDSASDCSSATVSVVDPSAPIVKGKGSNEHEDEHEHEEEHRHKEENDREQEQEENNQAPDKAPSPGLHISFATAPSPLPQLSAPDAAPSAPTPAPPRISFADATYPGAAVPATLSENSAATPSLDGHGGDDDGDDEMQHWRSIIDKSNVGRNGRLHSLSHQERERLGGCEYRALVVLSWVVPVYFFAWQLVGSLVVGALISRSFEADAAANGVNPWWAGFFYAVSAFNNSGMALLDANAMPFQRNVPIPLVLALLILAGNTAFPVLLRFCIWFLLKVLNLATAPYTLFAWKEALEFILHYPRRVYTNLFPARQTWWLVFMLVLTNAVDAGAFVLMNIGNPTLEAIPLGNRIVDAIFQATAVRAGGFYIVPIGSLYIGCQFLFVIMMYVNAFPVVIAMRNSNVYEERSLGRYADDGGDNDDYDEKKAFSAPAATPPAKLGILRRPTRAVGHALRRAPTQAINSIGSAVKRGLTFHGVGVNGSANKAQDQSRADFMAAQVRGQLSHDLWWLAAAVLAITTIETAHFLGDPVAFSTFNIIFEVVSAYGCVGISIGVPWDAYSFSGGWRPASKLILCLVMLRGRHRGLPVAIDRAVRLPSERMHAEEEEDHRRRLATRQAV